jgi:DNA-binding CsgD family transcriptional regulator
VFADHPDFAALSRRAAEIMNEIDDQDGLSRQLVRLVEDLTEHSVGFVGGFGQSKSLSLSVADVQNPLKDVEERATYVAGGYLLDPYYALYRAGRSGCFTLRDVMPDGFEETEFFRHYYLRHGICDEVIHLTTVPGQGAVNIGVVRSERVGVFTREEIARHRAIHPFIAACASRCSDLLVRPEDDERFQPMSLDAALEGFGEGLLTPRENDVIGLVLYGHNTQSVAVQLGISADTVKLHRKHAYAKLRVSSQGELFFKFLEHLGLETSE